MTFPRITSSHGFKEMGARCDVISKKEDDCQVEGFMSEELGDFPTSTS